MEIKMTIFESLEFIRNGKKLYAFKENLSELPYLKLCFEA